MSIPEWQVNAARWVNLAVPGAGLLLLGHGFTGAASLLLFTAAGHGVLWSLYITPDDWSPWAPAALGAATAACYVASQLLTSQAVRAAKRTLQRTQRRQLIAASQQLRDEGDLREALARLEPLQPSQTPDLLLAVRHAQLLLASHDWAGARRAWERVRRMDRHRIYQTVSDEALRTIAEHASEL